VKRHEILRTTFTVVDGRPFQVIHPAEPVTLPLFDVANEANPEAAAERIFQAEGAPVVDLRHGPLVRFSLIRIRENEHWLLRKTHHMLGDAWSAHLLLSELARFYTARMERFATSMPEPEPLQYADYAAWQRNALRRDRPAYQEAVAWWKGCFAKQPPPPDLPFKRSAPLDGVAPADGVLSWPINPQLMQRLTRLAHDEAVTNYVVGVAALAALLADEARQADVVIGTYVTNRRRASLQNMMGDFTNLAALTFRYDRTMSFREWLSDVRFRVMAMEARCEIPYEELREELQRLGITVPEVRLIFLRSSQALETKQFAGLSLSPPDAYPAAAMPWGITINLIECGGNESFRVAFDAGIYHPAGVRRFIGRLCELLDAASRRLDLSLGELLTMGETV
jgi:hypothetical protein